MIFIPEVGSLNFGKISNDKYYIVLTIITKQVFEYTLIHSVGEGIF